MRWSNRRRRTRERLRPDGNRRSSSSRLERLQPSAKTARATTRVAEALRRDSDFAVRPPPLDRAGRPRCARGPARLGDVPRRRRDDEPERCRRRLRGSTRASDRTTARTASSSRRAAFTLDRIGKRLREIGIEDPSSPSTAHVGVATSRGPVRTSGISRRDAADGSLVLVRLALMWGCPACADDPDRDRPACTSMYTTKRILARADMPRISSRSSWTRSGWTKARSSSKTVFASSNETECFRRFDAALRGSQRKGMPTQPVARRAMSRTVRPPSLGWSGRSRARSASRATASKEDIQGSLAPGLTGSRGNATERRRPWAPLEGPHPRLGQPHATLPTRSIDPPHFPPHFGVTAGTLR